MATSAKRDLLFALPATVVLVITIGLPTVWQPVGYAAVVLTAAIMGWLWNQRQVPQGTANYFMFWTAVALTVGSLTGWFLYA